MILFSSETREILKVFANSAQMNLVRIANIDKNYCSYFVTRYQCSIFKKTMCHC